MRIIFVSSYDNSAPSKCDSASSAATLCELLQAVERHTAMAMKNNLLMFIIIVFRVVVLFFRAWFHSFEKMFLPSLKDYFTLVFFLYYAKATLL